MLTNGCKMAKNLRKLPKCNKKQSFSAILPFYVRSLPPAPPERGSGPKFRQENLALGCVFYIKKIVYSLLVTAVASLCLVVPVMWHVPFPQLHKAWWVTSVRADYLAVDVDVHASLITRLPSLVPACLAFRGIFWAASKSFCP